VHAIVEVDDCEGNVLHGGELVQLVSEARISHGCGGCKQINIRDTGELTLNLREIVSRDGVAYEENVGKLWFDRYWTNLPCPLDLFWARSGVFPDSLRMRNPQAARED
jgi:hypothetical protein